MWFGVGVQALLFSLVLVSSSLAPICDLCIITCLYWSNSCLFKLLLGNLRRGLHPKLAALRRPRNLGAPVSQKPKAEDAPSQRSLRQRKRRLQPRRRQGNSQPLRKNPRRHQKPRPSRERLLQESPKHRPLKSWPRGSPSNRRPKRRPQRRPRSQRRRRGAGPSDPSPRSRPTRSPQWKSQRTKVGRGGPSHPPKSLQWKRGRRAASSLPASPREGSTEARSALRTGSQQSAALFSALSLFINVFSLFNRAVGLFVCLFVFSIVE